ncbi:unnamed protein product, partial [Callosobruchus maculatus]
ATMWQHRLEFLIHLATLRRPCCNPK